MIKELMIKEACLNCILKAKNSWIPIKNNL